MTVGNLIALRQTNIVRMLAYSGIAQAGYMLAPFAVAGTSAAVGQTALTPIVTYLRHLRGHEPRRLRRGHRRRPQDPLGRDRPASAACSSTRPGLTVAMTIFLFSLAGIPPLGGWFAKFGIFGSLVSAGTDVGLRRWPSSSAVNSVIALFYYARVAQGMWFEDAPDGDLHPDPGARLAADRAGAHRRRHADLRRLPGPRDPLHRHVSLLSLGR